MAGRDPRACPSQNPARLPRSRDIDAQGASEDDGGGSSSSSGSSFSDGSSSSSGTSSSSSSSGGRSSSSGSSSSGGGSSSGAAPAYYTWPPYSPSVAYDKDTAGVIRYGPPVASGACSIPLSNPKNNVVVAVIVNTDYVYDGGTTKYGYTLDLGPGVTGRADILGRWYR